MLQGHSTISIKSHFLWLTVRLQHSACSIRSALCSISAFVHTINNNNKRQCVTLSKSFTIIYVKHISSMKRSSWSCTTIYAHDTFILLMLFFFICFVCFSVELTTFLWAKRRRNKNAEAHNKHLTSFGQNQYNNNNTSKRMWQRQII